MADFSIASQIQPMKLPDPVQQYAQFNQLALHQAQLGEYQRSQGEQNQLRQLLGSGINRDSPQFREAAYRISPRVGEQLEQQLNANKKAALDQQMTQLQINKHNAEMAEYQRSQGEQNQIRQFFGGSVDLNSEEARNQAYAISPNAGKIFDETRKASNDARAQNTTNAAAQQTAAVANVSMLIERLTAINGLPPALRDAAYAKFYQEAVELVPGWANHLLPTYDEPTARQQVMTAAEAVKAHAERVAAERAEAKGVAPTIYPGTADIAPQAYVPGKNGALGTMSLIPETPIATNVPNPVIPPPAAAAAGTNQLALAPAIPTTPSEMRAQAATRAQEKFKAEEQIRRDMRAELTLVQEQKLRKEHGDALANVNEGLTSAQGVLDAANALRVLPDVDKGRILGFINSNIPNPTDAAKKAQTKFNDVKGQITAMAKAQAGSIGSMAVQEWQILANQITTLEAKNLTPALLNEQLGIIIARAEDLLRKTRSNYNATYAPMIAKHGKDFELGPPSSGAAPPRPPLSTFGGG